MSKRAVPDFNYEPKTADESKGNIENLIDCAHTLNYRLGDMEDLVRYNNSHLSEKDLSTNLRKDDTDSDPPTLERALRHLEGNVAYSFWVASLLRESLLPLDVVEKPQSRKEATENIGILALEIASRVIAAKAIAKLNDRWPKKKEDLRIQEAVQEIKDRVKVLDENTEFLLALGDSE